MPTLAQLLTDLGNAAEAARTHIATFESQHIGVLREIATQAENVAAEGALHGPEAAIVDLVATVIDDLHGRFQHAFTAPSAPPPDGGSVTPPAAAPAPAPGPF